MDGCSYCKDPFEWYLQVKSVLLELIMDTALVFDWQALLWTWLGNAFVLHVQAELNTDTLMFQDDDYRVHRAK